MKYYSMCYLTKREVKNINGNFIKQKAIENNICFRCGNKVEYDQCENCNEFGILKRTDYLYKLDRVVTNPEYIKYKSKLLFTKLQKDCANSMIDNYMQNKSMLIWAVCGAGKTEITFPVIEQALINKENICFAIPRIDILYDVYERLCEYFSNVNIKVLNSNEPKYTNAQIYVMTTNQILKFKKCFSICIVDEVDAFPYEHNIKYDYGIRESLLENKGSIFYLTSTPSNNLLNKNLEHFIINRRWHGFDLPVPKLKYLNLKYIKYSYSINNIIKNNKRQQLWFVSNIELAKHIQGILKDRGRKMDVVYAADINRRQKVIDFKNEKIDILITTTILERGVTFDDIDVYVLDSSSSMYNKAALVQIAGRVNRKKEYQSGIVYFFHTGRTKVIDDAIKEIKYMNNK